MDEFEAHVRCVLPWLWVTEDSVVVFFYFYYTLFNVMFASVDISANYIHSESQWSNTNKKKCIEQWIY